jgi:hypothetical protein
MEVADKIAHLNAAEGIARAKIKTDKRDADVEIELLSRQRDYFRFLAK